MSRIDEMDTNSNYSNIKSNFEIGKRFSNLKNEEVKLK